MGRRVVFHAWRWCGLVLAGMSAGCGSGKDGPGIVNPPLVTSVVVSQPSVSPIDIGATVQLTVNVQVQNGASQGVTWSSGSPSIATVDQSGNVTGVAGGQATITATSVFNSSKSGSVTVAVNQPRVLGITLTGAKSSTRVGESFSVTATVDARGPIARTVTFTSGNSSLATVSSADGLTGTIVGVSAGSTTITVASVGDPTKSATFPLNVTGTARIIGVLPLPVNIRPGQSLKLVPNVQADPGVTSAVTYQSQNTAVATVGSDGSVTGVAVGQTSIVLTAVADAQQKFTVPVTVRSGVLSVSLTPHRDSVRPTLSHQLTLNVQTEQGVSAAVSLSSANPAIVTIDNSARITGVAIGEAYVRAVSTVDPSVRDSTLVVVTDPCTTFARLAIGTSITGAVTDASCNRALELFKYSVTETTMLSISSRAQFTSDFSFALGWYFPGVAADQLALALLLLPPGSYTAFVAAKDVSNRGTFTLTAARGWPANTCGASTATGIVATLSLSTQCWFTPLNRPTGNYYLSILSILQYFNAGDRLTVTVTTNGFVPLIQTEMGVTASGSTYPSQSIAAGTNSVTHSVVIPEGGYPTLWISSRDASQTGTFTVTVTSDPVKNVPSAINIGAAIDAATAARFRFSRDAIRDSVGNRGAVPPMRP
jgi:uncharacterized protein YjdB